MSVVGLLQQMMAPLMGQPSTKAAGGDDALSGGSAFDALLSQQLAGTSTDMELAVSGEPLPSEEAVLDTMVGDASTEGVAPEESFTLSVAQEPLPLSFMSPLPVVSLKEHTVAEDTTLLTAEGSLEATPTHATEENSTVPLVVLSSTPLLPQGLGNSYAIRSTKMMGERAREQDFSVNTLKDTLEEITVPKNDESQSVSINSTTEMMTSSAQLSISDLLSTALMADVKETNLKDKNDKGENTVIDAMPPSDVSSGNVIQCDGLVTNNPANISSNDASTMAAMAAQQGVANAMPMTDLGEGVKPNRTPEEIHGALAISSLPATSSEISSKLLLPSPPPQAKPMAVEHEPPQPFVIPMAGDLTKSPVALNASDTERRVGQKLMDEPTAEQSMALAESVSLEASQQRSSGVGVKRLLDGRGTVEMAHTMGSSSLGKLMGEESLSLKSHGQNSPPPISSVVGKPLTVTDLNGGTVAVNVSMAGTSGAALSEASGEQSVEGISVNTMGAMSSSQGVLGGFSPSSDVANNVVSQVVEGTVQAHLDSPTPTRPTQVSLILNPEHLGSVRVQLTANPPGGPDAGAIQARFIVSTPEAQTLLTQQLETLSHRLESQNVKLDRIHIILAPEGVSASQSSSSSTGSGLFQSGEQSPQSGSQGSNQGSQQGPSYQEQADRQQWFQQLAGGFNGQGHPNHSGQKNSLYTTPPKNAASSRIPLMEGGQRAQSPPSGGVDHRIASGTTNISLLI